ncbi:hypothetical protein EDB19DRAFT_1916427 [Suillus lakei]|nr:hypothetical protein EDB19DRAFT_1916427 [Suillus lakei]
MVEFQSSFDVLGLKRPPHPKISPSTSITPCELQETPERIGGDLAVWVQVFAQEFTMPHLERFHQCCVIENVQPLQHFAASHICVKGPLYLPGPVVATGVHIKCSPQPANTFTNELQATAMHDAPSAAICGGAEMGVISEGPVLSVWEKL